MNHRATICSYLHSLGRILRSRAFSVLLKTVEYQRRAGVLPYFGFPAPRLQQKNTAEEKITAPGNVSQTQRKWT